MKQYNEIRTVDGKEDDIVIDCDSIHLEDMDGKLWWLGVSKGNKRTTFHIKSKSKITIKTIENELKCKFIDQPELSSKKLLKPKK